MTGRQVLVQVIKLNRMSFGDALVVQNTSARRILNEVLMKKATISGYNRLLLVEHDPVYTIGIRTEGYSNADIAKLKTLGADFYQTNRGGLITFHGPGQLVAYPIIHLKDFHLSMRQYINRLETLLIDACGKFGVQAHTTEHTGVWVDRNKIAAIGVHGSRYVTTHGVALNCCTDLRWFQHIAPCGLEAQDLGVTSLAKELKREVTVKNTTVPFLQAFQDNFNCDLDILSNGEWES